MSAGAVIIITQNMTEGQLDDLIRVILELVRDGHAVTVKPSE